MQEMRDTVHAFFFLPLFHSELHRGHFSLRRLPYIIAAARPAAAKTAPMLRPVLPAAPVAAELEDLAEDEVVVETAPVEA